MERLRLLRTIVYVICAILAVQLALMFFFLKPSGGFVILGFTIIAILCLYLARVALTALNELIDKYK
ncbi:MAG: hypothetical protein LIO85_03095 [Rikenellaceae bacterium]|nr:hypothetical protein [Rikenellaceae bacterium]